MTDNAKTALAALRDSDHPLGRPLALCLMFEPANDQLLAASIFDLALALDSALHIPSESLLAAIRVQWWVDALSDNNAQTAPLVTQLHAQFQTHDGLQSDTIDLIGHWQTAAPPSRVSRFSSWQAVCQWPIKSMVSDCKPSWVENCACNCVTSGAVWALLSDNASTHH